MQRSTTKRQSEEPRWKRILGRFRGTDRRLAVLRERKVVPIAEYRRLSGRGEVA